MDYSFSFRCEACFASQQSDRRIREMKHNWCSLKSEYGNCLKLYQCNKRNDYSVAVTTVRTS